MVLDVSNPSAWLAALSVTDAPVPRAGVATALRYFASRMPLLKQDDQLSFLRAMDLHYPVRETPLGPPTQLAAFRYATQNALRLFYTKAGTSPRTLGVNPNDRIFRRFKVIRAFMALESRCCAARETWTDRTSRESFEGGGMQFIVPSADQVLEVIQ